MLLKFTDTKEIAKYLRFEGYITVKSEGVYIVAYEFNNKSFSDPLELTNELIDLQILSEVKTVQMSYAQLMSYELEYYLLNTNYLNVLASNLFVNSDININRLLNVNEVCKILSVTRPTVYKLINEGKIDSYLIVGQKKVKYIDLLRYIDSCKL
jgi:excisionase family DNA binding protein